MKIWPDSHGAGQKPFTIVWSFVLWSRRVEMFKVPMNILVSFNPGWCSPVWLVLLNQPTKRECRGGSYSCSKLIIEGTCQHSSVWPIVCLNGETRLHSLMKYTVSMGHVWKVLDIRPINDQWCISKLPLARMAMHDHAPLRISLG